MPRRFVQVTGYVLAGGASRRMGRSKAGLTLNGQTMLDRTLRLLRSVCPIAAVVGEGCVPPTLEGAGVLPDNFPGNGPLGGMLTGLMKCSTEYALFLSCDLPFMNRRFLEYLVQTAVGGGAQATVPQSADGRLQTLAAVYHRSCAAVFRARRALGDYKISHAFAGLCCRIIPAAQLYRHGFIDRIFDNMNTPGDYAEAVKQIEGNGL